MMEMKRFILQHGITQFRFNRFVSVNSVPVIPGAMAVHALGYMALRVEAMFSAMWKQGRNLNEVNAVMVVLANAGLYAKSLLEGAHSRGAKAQPMVNTLHTFDRGAFGSPLSLFAW